MQINKSSSWCVLSWYLNVNNKILISKATFPAKLNVNLTVRYRGYDRWVAMHGFAMKGLPCSFPMVDYSNCKPEELQVIIATFESGECWWEKLTDAECEPYRECVDAAEAKAVTLNPSRNEITQMTVESAPTSTPSMSSFIPQIDNSATE
jgi:hypothetical protein